MIHQSQVLVRFYRELLGLVRDTMPALIVALGGVRARIQIPGMPIQCNDFVFIIIILIILIIILIVAVVFIIIIIILIIIIIGGHK